MFLWDLVKLKSFMSYKVISIINISQLRLEDYEPLTVVLNKYFKKHGSFTKQNIGWWMTIWPQLGLY